VGAEIDAAGAAVVAFAAVDGGVEGDAVAGFEAAGVAAGGGDFAGGLVAHDEGRIAPAAGAVPAVDVATADAAGADANEDFVVGGSGRGKVLKLESRRGREDEGFHSGEAGRGGNRRTGEGRGCNGGGWSTR